MMQVRLVLFATLVIALASTAQSQKPMQAAAQDSPPPPPSADLCSGDQADSEITNRVHLLLQDCMECARASETLFKDASFVPADKPVVLLVPTNAAVDKLMLDDISPDQMRQLARRYVLVGDGSTLSPSSALKNLDGEEYSVTTAGDKMFIEGAAVSGGFHVNENNQSESNSTDSMEPENQNRSIGYYIIDGEIPDQLTMGGMMMAGEEQGQQGTSKRQADYAPLPASPPSNTQVPPPPPPAVGDQQQDQTDSDFDSTIGRDSQLSKFKDILSTQEVRQFLPELRDTPVTFFVPNDDAFRFRGTVDNALYFFLSHGTFGLFPELNEHVLLIDLTGRVLSMGENDCNNTDTNTGGSGSSHSESFSSSTSNGNTVTNINRSGSSSPDDCVPGLYITNPMARILTDWKQISDLAGYYVIDALLV